MSYIPMPGQLTANLAQYQYLLTSTFGYRDFGLRVEAHCCDVVPAHISLLGNELDNR